MPDIKPIDQSRRDNYNSFLSAWLMTFMPCLTPDAKVAFETMHEGLIKAAEACNGYASIVARTQMMGETVPEEIEQHRPSEALLARVCDSFALLFAEAKRNKLLDESLAADIEYLDGIVEQQNIVARQPEGYVPPPQNSAPASGGGMRP